MSDTIRTPVTFCDSPGCRDNADEGWCKKHGSGAALAERDEARRLGVGVWRWAYEWLKGWQAEAEQVWSKESAEVVELRQKLAEYEGKVVQ